MEDAQWTPHMARRLPEDEGELVEPVADASRSKTSVSFSIGCRVQRGIGLSSLGPI